MSDRDWRLFLRDIVVHDYFGIDEDILWDVISVRIPELKQHLDLIGDTQHAPPSP